MSQRAASENLLEQKINAILQATNSGTTQSQLAAIEARLASLHNQCQQSIDVTRPDSLTPQLLQDIQTSAPHESKASGPSAKATAPAVKENTESLVNLVDTALVLRIQSGQLTYNLEPAKDRVFAALSMLQKKAMVQYLQSLRLLLWLLRKENYLTITSCKRSQSLPSASTREASMQSLTIYRLSCCVVCLISHKCIRSTSRKTFPHLLFRVQLSSCLHVMQCDVLLQLAELNAKIGYLLCSTLKFVDRIASDCLPT